MKPPGILVSCFDYSPVAEDEFHDWYDTEHIPERQRVPGFLRCQRWLSAGGHKGSAATYDLQSIDVLRSPAYLAIGYDKNSPWTRRVGWRCVSLLRFEGELAAGCEAADGAGAGALLVRAIKVEPAFEGEFVERFREQHAPEIVALPGIHDVRLFRATAGTHNYVVIYRLHATDAVELSAWTAAAGEPRPQRMPAHGSGPLQFLYRRYARAPARQAEEVA